MKRFISALCALTIMLTSAASAVTLPETTAGYVILVETTSGRILFEHNADEPAYPASLTKIMTVMLALENLDLDQVLTVSNTALQNLSPYGSHARPRLIEYEQLTVRNLLYSAMLVSANEACNVLAEAVAGSVEAFVDMMNARAREIGANNTNFTNAHGLHDIAQVTTARDMYLITMEARRLPMFLQMAYTEIHELPPTNMHDQSRVWVNTNALIRRQHNHRPEAFYAPARGVKTGFTTPAGHCLVSLATLGGLEQLLVVMDAGLTDENVGRHFFESRRLLEWGFSNFERRELVNRGRPIISQEIAAGHNAGDIVLVTQDNFEDVMPNDFDPDDLIFRPVIDQDVGQRNRAGVLIAPVERNDVFGHVEIWDGEELLGTILLIANASVERAAGAYFSMRLSEFWEAYGTWLIVGIIALFALLIFYIIVTILYNKRRRREMTRGAWATDR
ncbi:MAG: D-alanyl-D-alanine carboxypeptidase [Oscillospiraceae bacterium]|nr:D-alanyl-D-alanine carboxypeptidase [Oscillospiraceae bacterium]